MSIKMHEYEALLADIRAKEPLHEGETVDGYMQRTAHKAWMIVEHHKPELPKVVEQRKRSARLKEIAGEPQQESKDEEEE